MSAPGIFSPPPPVNEPIRSYVPGHRSARASGSGSKRCAPSVSRSPASSAGRRSGPATCARRSSRTTRITSSPTSTRRPGRGRAGHPRRGRSVAGLEPDAVGGPGLDPPASCGAPVGTVARHAQRRDHARPVEDGPPGGDRRRLRDDRLLALQRQLPRAHLRGAADLLAGRLEPHRVQAARGLRARGQPLQLHGHRREPHHLAGADGLHDRLEAGLDRDGVRLLDDEAARGGRPAARGDQPRVRARSDDRRRGAREPRPRRRAFHGLDRGVPGHLEDRRRQYRALSQLPADRGRDGRQGLRRRAPVRGRRGARDRGDAGRVRVPGPEVLRGLAALRAGEPLAAAARAARRGDRDDQGRRRCRLHELHGRGDRLERLRDAARRDRGGEIPPGDRRRRRRRHRRLARATSWSRR